MSVENQGMETQSQESVVENQESTPAIQETNPTPSESSAVTSEAPVAPAYQPNFKFKSYDKEYEVPEWMRTIIKDQESEKQAKEVLEKAYGLDNLKTKYQQRGDQIKHLQSTIIPEYNNIKQRVGQVQKFLSSGDLDGVFESLGLSQQQVAQHLINKAQQLEMAPEQRAVYENELRLRRENEAYKEQLNQLTQGQEEAKLQSAATQLQDELSKPEIQAVAESFNQRLGGKPDAFWNFVCQQADMIERTTRQPLTAQQAVQEALKVLGVQTGQSQPQVSTPQTTAPAPQQASQKAPPVIPNVGNSSTSPTRKVAMSTDDLRKLYRQKSGQE